MDQKAAFTETIELALSRTPTHPPTDPSLSFRHLVEMHNQVMGGNFSESKIGRWLGWAQAALVASGSASLEEMKAINKKHSGNPEAPSAVLCRHCGEPIEYQRSYGGGMFWYHETGFTTCNVGIHQSTSTVAEPV